MKKFVPFKKMSKKEQRKINASKRNTWNGIDPSTRVVDTDKKKYNRKNKYSYMYE